MLAMRSYEQNEGFSVMTADELFYVNGGSGSSGTTKPPLPTIDTPPQQEHKDGPHIDDMSISWRIWL